ncbi:hypothetical protein K8O93_06740 [Gordonia bronchialis]|nr:hypothetical protein [Gordonia bronchialis]UAK39371.1 hypothetical protein K8O93_06740 [Gordonia bronchialis]
MHNTTQTKKITPRVIGPGLVIYEDADEEPDTTIYIEDENGMLIPEGELK